MFCKHKHNCLAELKARKGNRRQKSSFRCAALYFLVAYCSSSCHYYLLLSFLVSLHPKSRFNLSKCLYQQTELSLNLLHFIMTDVKSLQGNWHKRLPILHISLYTVFQISFWSLHFIVKQAYHLQFTLV